MNTQPTGDMEVAQFMNQWLENQRSRVRTTSFCVYQSQVQNYILPLLGDMWLSQVTYQTGDELREDLVGKGLSANLVRDVTSRFSQAMRWGVDQGYDLPVIRNQQEQSEQALRTLSVDEEEHLAASLIGEKESFVNAVILTWKAGLTIGEACALNWSDIDQKAGLINVHRLCQRVPGGLEYTEEEPRQVPIPDGLKMDGKCRGLVLQSARNGGTEPRLCQLWLRDHVKKTRLPQNLTYATLRNTYIRNLMESGTDFIQVSRLSGNKDLNDLWRKFGAHYTL